MWVYEKKLEYPINIKNCNPKMAKYIITQYGGPDGELGASIRYLSQRYSMPTNEAKSILNDIGISLPKRHIIPQTTKIAVKWCCYLNINIFIMKD